MKDNPFLQAQLISILENTIDLVAISTPDKKLTFINKAGREMLGFEPEEDISNFSILDAHPSSGQELLVNEALPEALRNGAWSGDTILRTRRGQEVPVSQVIIAHRKSDGTLEFLSTIMRDLTSCKETEKRLTQYGDIVSRMQAGLYVYRLDDRDDDRSLRLLNANNASTKALGLTKEESIGKKIDELFPNLREKGIPAKFAGVLRTGQPIEVEDFFYSDNRIENRCFSFKAYALPDDCVCVLFEDVTQRKLTEEALKVSEAFLNSAFEQSPYAQWISDEHGTLIKINKACKNLLHLTDEEVVGKYNVFDDTVVEQQGFMPLIKTVFEEGKKVQFILTYDAMTLKHVTLKQYTPIILDVSIAPIKNSAGKVTNAIIQHIDITARKQAESELQRATEKIAKSNKDWEQTFNSMGDGVALLSPDFKILNINEPFCSMLGKRREDMIGTKCYDVVHHRESPLPGCPCMVVLETKKRMDAELFEPNLKRWLSVSVSPVLSQDGTIQYMIHVVRDISVRKQMSEALEQSNRRLAEIIDFLPDATFAVDREGKIIAWNRAIEAMTGVKAGAMLGKGNYEYSLPFYGERRPILIDLALDGDEDLEKKYHDIRKEGDVIVAEVEVAFSGRGPRGLWMKAVPLYDSKHNIVGAIEAIRDINDRKLMEQNLQDREHKLKTIVNDMPVPQFVIGADHRILFWNKALEDISGIKAEDVIGTDQQWKAFYDHPRPCLSDLLVDQAYDKIDEYYRNKYVKSGYAQNTYKVTDLFPMQAKSGRWLTFSAAVIKDNNGTMIGAVETLEDITERKQAQDKLAASEEQYRTLVNNLSLAVFRNSADIGGSFVQGNPALAQLMGYDSVEEMLKIKVTALYPDPEDRKKYLEDIIKYGGVKSREMQFKKKDGSLVWASISGQAHYDPDGKIDWIDGIGEDITERKQAREILQRSEEKYRIVSDFTFDWEYWHGPDGRYIYMSPSCETITGYKPEEFILDPSLVERIIHVDDREAVADHRKQPPGEKAAHAVSFRIITRGGEERWLEHNCRPVFNEKGEYLGQRGSNRDITDRKKAENALQNSESKLRALFDNMSSGVVVHEAREDGNDFSIVAMNAAGARLSSRDRNKISGQSLLEVFPSIKDNGVFDVLKNVWKTGIPQHIPVTFYGDQHGFAWIENYVYKLPSNEIVVIFDDVTVRKQAEEERDRFFNMSIDMMAVAGLDGYFKQLNPSWTRTLGWTNQEMMSKPYIEFVHPDDVQETIEAGKQLQQNRPVLAFKNRYRSRDGKYFWLSWNSFPYPEQKIILAIARDVTEEQKIQDALKASELRTRQLNLELEERVRQRTAQLESSMKELDSFSYSVSHDLQAPLRAINGYANIMIEDHSAQLDEEGKKQLDRIAVNVRTMGQLINDLLSLSRLGRKAINFQNIDMNKLVMRCIEELKPSYEGREVVFETGDLVPGYGDETLVHEALINLLSNAIKFTRPRPKAAIEIGSYVKDGECVYYVKDNGVGFDMAYAGNIFKEFVRLHSEAAFEGTGIGLSIVNRVITRHGGRVWTEGAIDKGATFFFTLKKFG